MTDAKQLIRGEFSRKIDERFRLTLPGEFEEVFKPESGKCVIVKERPGCLSLWDDVDWKKDIDGRIDLIQRRMNLGDLGRNTPDLQRFGRLLSTRHREIQLAGRARLVLPEGFREFLAVEPGKEVMVVGASVCIEIWHPAKWQNYIEGDIAQFGSLLETLSH